MAQIVINNGDLRTGKKYITQAIDLQPKNLWYLLTLAGIYYQESNIDSAVLCYEKAVSYYPERENLLVSLGNLYSENKDLDKARMLFSKIDEKAGINEKTTVPLIRILLEETKYKEAQVKVLELLKENPDDILYNGLLAETYRGEGDKEKIGRAHV